MMIVHTNGLESSALPKLRLFLLICDLVFSDLIGQSKSKKKKMLILVFGHYRLHRNLEVLNYGRRA